MKRFAIAAVPLLLLLLAGCAAPPPVAEPSATASAACEQAFAAAAAVPFDQSNATEFIATFSACTTVAEWSAMLQKYPAAGAVPEITKAEVPIYLRLGCMQLPDSGNGNAICDEARASGLIE